MRTYLLLHPGMKSCWLLTCVQAHHDLGRVTPEMYKI